MPDSDVKVRFVTSLTGVLELNAAKQESWPSVQRFRRHLRPSIEEARTPREGGNAK